MTLYVVSTKQVVLASVLLALIVPAGQVAYSEWDKYLNLPVIEQTADGRCVRVVNFRNGDGYQCHDVGVILRQYRRTLLLVPEVQPEQRVEPPAPPPPPPQAPAAKALKK